MPNETRIVVQPIMAAMSPLAMAKFSFHSHEMGRTYDAEGDARLARLYMFCVSIELGLKALILAIDCTKSEKKILKNIGHKLSEIYEHYLKRELPAILDEQNLQTLQRIEKYFARKGLEYCTPEILSSMMTAYKDLPTVADMLLVSSKIQEQLRLNEYCLHATSSDRPTRGIIGFI